MAAGVSAALQKVWSGYRPGEGRRCAHRHVQREHLLAAAGCPQRLPHDWRRWAARPARPAHPDEHLHEHRLHCLSAPFGAPPKKGLPPPWRKTLTRRSLAAVFGRHMLEGRAHAYAAREKMVQASQLPGNLQTQGHNWQVSQVREQPKMVQACCCLETVQASSTSSTAYWRSRPKSAGRCMMSWSAESWECAQWRTADPFGRLEPYTGHRGGFKEPADRWQDAP